MDSQLEEKRVKRTRTFTQEVRKWRRVSRGIVEGEDESRPARKKRRVRSTSRIGERPRRDGHHHGRQQRPWRSNWKEGRIGEGERSRATRRKAGSSRGKRRWDKRKGGGDRATKGRGGTEGSCRGERGGEVDNRLRRQLSGSRSRRRLRDRRRDNREEGNCSGGCPGTRQGGVPSDARALEGKRRGDGVVLRWQSLGLKLLC